MSHLEGKRIAILAEDDFEDVELVEPIKAMKEAGVKAKVIIGGAPVTQAYASEIGADGYAADAASAADLALVLNK